MNNFFFKYALIAYFPISINAQDTLNNKMDAFTFEASYVGDNINNLSGGIKTGSCYLGIANIKLEFDFEKAMLWKGGQFYVNVTNTHGSAPSSELLGDMQVASNIEAGEHTFIQELWLRQVFGKFEITVGLQDLNVEFSNTEHGSLFLNSSFGIMPVISGNIPAPIYPLTNLGLTVKWNFSEKIIWLNALYDGSPADFEDNPYNIKWHYSRYDGITGISEFQYNSLYKELSGVYKLGIFSYNHVIENDIPDSLNTQIVGFYAHADQKLWISGDRNVGFFTQIGFCPSKESMNVFFLSIGINFTGMFNKTGKDVIGAAFAYEQFNNNLKSETSVEISYQYLLSKSIFIQPDIQYIINPAGTGETLNNCLTGNLRFGISF